MRFFISALVVLIGLSALSSYQTKRANVTVEVEPIINDSLLNVRALEVLKFTEDQFACIYLSSRGEFGILMNSGLLYECPNPNFSMARIDLSSDTLVPNFRALAAANEKGFGMTIGSPAYLFNLDVDKPKNKIIYVDDHKDAFYDSMEFWNENEGIVMGDPTEGCMSILITRDAGDSWEKLDCSKLPPAMEGEAAFAASDTNIALVGDHTWIATGGKVSRILYSHNKGKDWEIFETPIIQGKETTGLYSIDFYDEFNGFGIGGDYTEPDKNSKNKIRTNDGGRSWKVVSDMSGPGYRSCVQYVPNSNAQKLVAIGFKGIDYSDDGGESWQHISDEGFYTLRFLNDSTAFAAGKGRVSKLKFSH